jgi:predicted DNA-binding protein
MTQRLPDDERTAPVAVRLPPPVIDALKKLAKAQHVTRSKLIREAVEIHLRDRKMLGDR